jgi:xanthine dehydrogenase accessory factor
MSSSRRHDCWCSARSISLRRWCCSGAFLGYRVTACDALGVFTTAARIPAANEVVVNWPHRYLAAEAAAGRVDRRTVVTVLTHDPKFDVPLLDGALRLDLAYDRAMGWRRTQNDRLARLREAGMTDVELARLCSPIGLDLGAPTPDETAVSIAAGIIALRWGGGGERLMRTQGPIHAHEGTRCSRLSVPRNRFRRFGRPWPPVRAE